jgi:hypothetical protein
MLILTMPVQTSVFANTLCVPKATSHSQRRTSSRMHIGPRITVAWVNASDGQAPDYCVGEGFRHPACLNERPSPLAKVLNIAADCRRINGKRISEY